MKLFLKHVFLVFILLFFISTGVLLQNSLTLRNTIFSADYFGNSLDKTGMGESMVRFVHNAVNNAGTFMPLDNEGAGEQSKRAGQELMESSKKMLQASLDTDWIGSEFPKTLQGVYSYFLSGGERLPVVDIKPLKEMFVDMSVQQVMAQSGSGSLKETDRMVAEVKNLAKKYSASGSVTDRLVDQMMELEQFKAMNLSREQTGGLAQMILSPGGRPTEQIRESAVTEMIKGNINFDEIKEELDLNLLFETMYGGKDNYVSETAALMNTIKSKVFLTVVLLFILLFLIITVTLFSPKSVLRWTGAGLLLSGLVGLAPYFYHGLVDSAIINSFGGISEQARGLDIAFIQKWLRFYADGIWRQAIVHGLMFVLLGIVFIAASFFMNRFLQKTTGESGMQADHLKKKTKNLLLATRAAVIVLLLCAFLINTAVNTNQLRASVERYNQIRESARTSAKNISEALGIVLNAEDLMEMVRGDGYHSESTREQEREELGDRYGNIK